MKHFWKCLALLLAMLIGLSGCQAPPVANPDPPLANPKEQQPEPNLEELAEALFALADFPEMLALSGTRLTKFYTIDSEQLDSFAVYLCAEAILSDEIILLRAKDQKDVKALQAKLETRLKEQKKSFDDYLPKEGEKIGEALKFINHKDLIYIVAGHDTVETLREYIETVYKLK